jgi:hypothetical protein
VPAPARRKPSAELVAACNRAMRTLLQPMAPPPPPPPSPEKGKPAPRPAPGAPPPKSQEQMTQELRAEVARAYTPAGIRAAMHVLAHGDASLYGPALDMLAAATSQMREARGAALEHAAGMRRLVDVAFARLAESPLATAVIASFRAAGEDVKPKLAPYLAAPLLNSTVVALKTEAARRARERSTLQTHHLSLSPLAVAAAKAACAPLDRRLLPSPQSKHAPTCALAGPSLQWRRRPSTATRPPPRRRSCSARR